MSAPIQVGTTLEAAAATAGRKAARHLGGIQARDGHWCGEITAADATLESGYILFQLWLHPPVAGKWTPDTRPLIAKAVRSILSSPLASNLDAAIQAYAALKLAGLPITDARMQQRRQAILDAGGLQAAGPRLKIFLSLFGLYPAQDCAAIPPELVLLPFDFLYQIAAWDRTVLVPLSIVQALAAPRPVPAGFSLDEIQGPPGQAATVRERYTRFLPRSLRRRAIEKGRDWVLDHMRHSDGLAAAYPAMMYSVMALDSLGYPADDPLRMEALRQFNSLMVDEGDRFCFQPYFAPVWDTAFAAYALGEQSPTDPALPQSAEWLRAREIRRQGDWSRHRPNVEPSGWALQYSNEFYPSIDATAMVLLALRQPHERGTAWLQAMQSADGGWAAFDAGQPWKLIDRLSFASRDTCRSDVTGRALEALIAQGIDSAHPAIRRGVKWLVDHQEADGSWAAPSIYATCFALRGLAAAGESDREAHILRAGEWLRSIQNADGGWGENTGGKSTPSQTAWAILGLIAGGDPASLSVQHGIEYLLENQLEDGSWPAEPATGTGSLPGSSFDYHLYKDYFPLMALSSFVKARAASNG